MCGRMFHIESKKLDGVARQIIFFPWGGVTAFLIFFIFIFLLLILFSGAVGYALARAGIPRSIVPIIFFLELILSSVNIPVYRIRSYVEQVEYEYVWFMGMVYRVPRYVYAPDVITVAVNVGGAIIPTLISLYLMIKNVYILPEFLLATLLVSIVSYLVSKPVPGLGIVTPAFVPPLATALIAYLVYPIYPAPIAFVSGTLGTLLGADLFRLSQIPNLKAKFVSIGGAGIFDGIFLSGIIATLLI